MDPKQREIRTTARASLAMLYLKLKDQGFEFTTAEADTLEKRAEKGRITIELRGINWDAPAFYLNFHYNFVPGKGHQPIWRIMREFHDYENIEPILDYVENDLPFALMELS